MSNEFVSQDLTSLSNPSNTNPNLKLRFLLSVVIVLVTLFILYLVFTNEDEPNNPSSNDTAIDSSSEEVIDNNRPLVDLGEIVSTLPGEWSINGTLVRGILNSPSWYPICEEISEDEISDILAEDSSFVPQECRYYNLDNLEIGITNVRLGDTYKHDCYAGCGFIPTLSGKFTLDNDVEVNYVYQATGEIDMEGDMNENLTIQTLDDGSEVLYYAYSCVIEDELCLYWQPQDLTGMTNGRSLEFEQLINYLSDLYIR